MLRAMSTPSSAVSERQPEGCQASSRVPRAAMAAASAAPSRYSRLGRDKLGEGAYGIVCPAWDSQEQRVVAIKQQRRDGAEAPREMLIYDGLPRHLNLL